MTAGVQTFDGAGGLRFGSGDFLPRFLGVIETGTGNGQYTDGNFANGIPFFTYMPYGVQKQPRVYLSGNTIYWTFGGGSGSPINGRIIFGIR